MPARQSPILIRLVGRGSVQSPEFVFMMARRGCGTGQAPCHRMFRNLGPTFGSPGASQFWGRPLVQWSTPHTEKVERRLADERLLWAAVPDFLCAWQILLQSANPRANHIIRTLPPAMSAGYAQGHDEGTSSPKSQGARPQDRAQQLATLPMRMGGLGLRSASRCSPAVCWASWADALPMIDKRNPAITEMVEHPMVDDEVLQEGCVSELSREASDLDRQGFAWRPTWPDLRRGKRPPENLSKEPGEWQHGWQYWSSSVSDTHFRKISMLSGRTAAKRARLRSHSGRNAGVALAHAPTAREYTIPPHLFRVLLLERMRLPLPITEARCSGSLTREDSTERLAHGQGESENVPLPKNAHWRGCFARARSTSASFFFFSTSANFDFGQFRFRPMGTPKGGGPKMSRFFPLSRHIFLLLSLS